MNAPQALDDQIKVALQTYLKTPREDRTQMQYDSLVWSLTQAAIDYARETVKERVESKRQAQKQVGQRGR